MKAKVLKVVGVESHSTVREVMAALREVLRAEGKEANEWTVVVVERAQDEERPQGITTGMSFSPPYDGGGSGGRARVRVVGFGK